MRHTPPIFINQGKNTLGYFTLKKPKTLLIFVHGFNGSSTGTWDDFPLLIKTREELDETDVLFYGYDSLKGQANNNALKFYYFLKQALDEGPNALGHKRKETPAAFAYQKVVIVAHSLGSIVVRRALLHAHGEAKPWLKNTRMLLFAPAHRGARIQKLLTESLPLLGKMLAGLGFLAYPVLDDLRPDSETITHLIEDTETVLKEKNSQFAIAEKVVWAANEKVVHNEQFCKDPVPELIDDKSHTTVCKPKEPVYLTPYQIILSSL